MGAKKSIHDILERHQLKKTEPRLQVLSVLSNRRVATSQPELERLLGKEVDRVTLYRTLNTFEKNGIIHKVLDMHGTSNYALCSDSCTADQHNDQHVHFNCTRCEQIYCLNEVKVPGLQGIPHGFEPTGTDLIIYGFCRDCTEKKETG